MCTRTRSLVSLAASLLVLCGACLRAQKADYRFSPALNTCTSATEHFDVVGLPILGRTFKIRTLGAGCPIVGCYGTLIVTGRVMPPFDLRTLSPRFCGRLFVTPDAIHRAPGHVGGNYEVDVPFRVPSDKRLLGVRVYQQVIFYATTPSLIVHPRVGIATIGMAP